MNQPVNWVIVFLLGLFFSCSSEVNFTIQELKTNHLSNPIGLEEKPVFSWKASTFEDFIQKSYRILVASTPENLNVGMTDFWDSGEIFSSQSLGIAYQGNTPKSGQQLYWKVQVRNNQDQVYASDPAWFEMGLLSPDDWQASWIAAVSTPDSTPPLLPAPYFRKDLSLDMPFQSARLYISGLGYYEAFINGKKVGDHVLDPSITRYDKSVKYVVHDVTDLLKQGENAIGVVLGNGWYNQHTREAWNFDQAPWRSTPSLRAQLKVVDFEGKEHWINTNESWRCTINGPIIFDSVHNGETYDASKEMEGWSMPGFKEEGWESAHLVAGPKGKMVAQVMPPIRIIKSLPVQNRWEINDSTLMLDLGQNITGWANIKVKGAAGSRVKIRYGERIFPDSTLDIKELSRFIFSGNTQTDRYYLKGEGEESWHPVFTYQGFQYMEVTLSDPEIALLDIKADVVHTDLKEIGYFKSSNAMFNQLQQNIHWSFLGNYHGYPTDCPHREKMGWSGDALLVAETSQYNFDMVAAYSKWLDDFVDEQRENGDLPGIIPTSGWGYTFTQGQDPDRGYGPHWEGAFLEIAWQMYLFSGDSLLLKDYYPNMKKYIDYLAYHADENLLNFGIDDHKQLEKLTEGPFLSTAFFHYFSHLLSKMAGVLEKEEDREKYLHLTEKIATAFNQTYFNPQTGQYDHGGQTSQAVPLFVGLVPMDKEKLVLDGLLKAIANKDGHIDAGVVGTKAILNVLMDFNQSGVIYDMANKRTFPGWGYWVDALHANTMFQNWDGSQSRNHIMFGTIGDYFFKGLGGIQPLEAYPGFERFLIQPLTDNDLEWVESLHDSPYGIIYSNWRKDATGLSVELRVPSNSRAELRLPVKGKPEVIEGHPVSFESISSENTGDFYRADLPAGEYLIRQNKE